MLWAKLVSWFASYWMELILSAVVLGGFWWVQDWIGDRREAEVNARWEARVEAARVAAEQATARQNARLLAANGALKDAQEHIAARDTAIGLLGDRLRVLAARPRDLPIPADYPRCVAELAAERDRSATLGELLVAGNTLARELGRERDDAVARLWAAAEAWPR